MTDAVSPIVILPLKHKMEISTFSVGICLAKCLTRNISAVMRDRWMVSKDHLYETIYRDHKPRSLVNFGGQDIFAGKYMHEKLTKCPNFNDICPRN